MCLRYRPQAQGSVEGARAGGGEKRNRHRWGEEPFRPLSMRAAQRPSPSPPPGTAGQWPSSAAVPGRGQARRLHTTQGLERRPGRNAEPGERTSGLCAGSAPGPPRSPSLGVGCEGLPAEPSPAAGSEEAASPAEATAGSAGRSLLSWPAWRPEPTVDLRPLTLWILFRAIVGGGWRRPPGRGRGQGRDGEGARGREAASVIAGRPEKMGSSEARVRREGLRAGAHSAPEPAAAVTASPGGGPFMCCRPSRRRRRRRSCLFLLSSAPPPQSPRIPPPGSDSPGLGHGRRLSVGQAEGLPAAGGRRDARAGRRAAPPGWGRRSAGWAQDEGQVGRRGDWRPGEGGPGRAGGGGIRAAPVSILRTVAATAAWRMTPRSAGRSRESVAWGRGCSRAVTLEYLPLVPHAEDQ